MTNASRRHNIGESEWAARVELAGTYRVFDLMGWSEMIYNHISLKVPGEDGVKRPGFPGGSNL